MKAIDLTGHPFGRLTVESFHGHIRREGKPFRAWNCRCECGAKKVVGGYLLRAGKATSCGCAQREATTKHGLYLSPEYRAWIEMKQRCTDPKRRAFKHYGGRGIKVCERWADFNAFLADMGARPGKGYSLERVHNDRGYEPGNRKWATPTEQQRNKSRRHDNRSGVTGVYWSERLQKWIAHIRVDGRNRHIGCFQDLAEAAEARRAKAAEFGFGPRHGEARHANV